MFVLKLSGIQTYFYHGLDFPFFAGLRKIKILTTTLVAKRLKENDFSLQIRFVICFQDLHNIFLLNLVQVYTELDNELIIILQL